MVRPHTRKLDIFAKIVTTFSAEPAVLAGHARFNCYSIACFAKERQRFCPPFRFFFLPVAVYSFALSITKKALLTNNKILDSISKLEHDTGSLMSKDTITFHN